MKKCILLFLTMILTISLIACGNSSAPKEEKSLESVSKQYTLDEAKDDGCMVIEGGKLTAGQAVFDQFLADTADGKDTVLRVVDHFDAILSSVYGASDILYISDILYRDNTYTVQYYEDGKLHTETFQYLVKDTFEAPTTDATFTDGVTWFLCNDETLTEEDISQSLISSSAQDALSFHTIYTEYHYKENL